MENTKHISTLYLNLADHLENSYVRIPEIYSLHWPMKEKVMILFILEFHNSHVFPLFLASYTIHRNHPIGMGLSIGTVFQSPLNLYRCLAKFWEI